MTHSIEIHIGEMSTLEAVAWIEAITEKFGAEFVCEWAEDSEDSGQYDEAHAEFADRAREWAKQSSAAPDPRSASAIVSASYFGSRWGLPNASEMEAAEDGAGEQPARHYTTGSITFEELAADAREWFKQYDADKRGEERGMGVGL
jgi:enoyl-CoA hydratase/carnithine racemase